MGFIWIEDDFTTEARRMRRLRGGFMTTNQITQEIIGAAIAVHQALGPGLLESAYQNSLCQELHIRRVPYERDVPLPLAYKGVPLGCAYRVDLLVAESVVVEVKSVEAIEPVFEAQLLTYLRLGGWQVGLLINFNVPVLKQGVRRTVLNWVEESSA
jgi:GxxExxY protein